MRRLLAIASLLLAVIPSVCAAEVKLARVWPGWREAESFERISEFFTGKENTSRKVILRTQPADRGGYYFLVRLQNPGTALTNAKFSLQVIAPDNPQPKTFVFPATIAAGKAVFDLGLTGTDWAGKKTHPVAWKLELQAPDGNVIASAKSFLWEKPAQ